MQDLWKNLELYKDSDPSLKEVVEVFDKINKTFQNTLQMSDKKVEIKVFQYNADAGIVYSNEAFGDTTVYN